MSNTFNISASGSFTLQTAGNVVLSRVIINNAGAAAGSTITIYDSPTASGTVLATLHASAVSTQQSYEYGSTLQHGLTVVNGNPASDITVIVNPAPTNAVDEVS